MPTITPQIIAKTKPRITSPPRMKSATRARSVVTEVIIVRLRVSLIEMLSTSLSAFFLYFRRFSRTRSKTTTVSLSE